MKAINWAASCSIGNSYNLKPVRKQVNIRSTEKIAKVELITASEKQGDAKARFFDDRCTGSDFKKTNLDWGLWKGRDDGATYCRTIQRFPYLKWINQTFTSVKHSPRKLKCRSDSNANNYNKYGMTIDQVLQMPRGEYFELATATFISFWNKQGAKEKFLTFTCIPLDQLLVQLLRNALKYNLKRPLTQSNRIQEFGGQNPFRQFYHRTSVWFACIGKRWADSLFIYSRCSDIVPIKW